MKAQEMIRALKAINVSQYMISFETGIPQPTINRIATGKISNPGEDIVLKIAACAKAHKIKIH